MSDKKVTYCKCGIPVGKRLDSKMIETVRNYKGTVTKQTLRYSGDTSSIECGNCDHTTNFMTNSIPLSMTYVVRPQVI